MKNKFVVGMSLLLAISALSACGEDKNSNSNNQSESHSYSNSDSSQSDDSSSGQIKVWCAENAVDLTKKQLEDFKKENPKLKVNFKVEAQGEGDAASNMVTDVEAGADIFCFAQDQLARLVSAGALSEVTGESAKIVKEGNDEESVAAASLNNKIYAYPLTSDNGYFMYYDKTVVSEDSIDSLEEIIKDVKKADKLISYQLATDGAWYNAGFFMATGCTSNWKTNNEGQFISYEDTYNTDKGLVALKGMSKLITSGVWNNASSVGEFNSGSAVVISGTWGYNDAVEILGDKLGVTDLPSFTISDKEYHINSFYGNKLIGIKPQSNASKAVTCQLVAEYLTGEIAQKERFDELSWGPSNIKAQQDDDVLENKALTALKEQSEFAKLQGQYPGDWWTLAASMGSSVSSANSDGKVTDEELKNILSSYESGLDALLTK